jgi:hypothetical protein
LTLYNPVYTNHLCDFWNGCDLNHWNSQLLDTGCQRCSATRA